MASPSWTPQPSDYDKLDRWDRSWDAFGTAWRLMTRTPALKGTAAAAFAAFVVAFLVLFGPVFAWWISTDNRLVLVAGSAIAAFPFLFVTIYFTVAMLAAANACMDGERLTVRQSFAVANRRLWQIAGWSLLAAGVGAVLDALAEWIPGFGHVARWVLGTAWGLATIFAIPVIVIEGVGGRQAALRSARTFRQAWGDAVVGYISITFCTIVLTIPACLAIGTGLVAGATVGGLILAGVGVALLAVSLFLSVTLERLYALVLYRFIHEGEVHGGFSERQLRDAVFTK
ncbi:MAG TPA: DUF6159 family protein [Solirubrobacteraceae bacterium]|nr:DUF6159 family protein [Solirubrobacteraceae bacterium]